MNYVQSGSTFSVVSPIEPSPAADFPNIEVVPVVLCGGAGARLWPASRASRPKQFISLVGDGSTFQAAVRRVAGSPLFKQPLVVASQEHRFVVAEQLAAITEPADIMLEPERRDSAAAIAAATVHVARTNPSAVILTLAADHVIDDEIAFRACVKAAAALARQGYITTLGIVPTEPATGFGYIRPGPAIDGTEAFSIDRFVEKPNAKLAQEYVDEGYLWNSGNFVFRADVMLEELERCAPRILAAARQAVERAERDLDFVRLDPGSFNAAPATSIDFAVMEKTTHGAVLRVRYSWSDIGSWGTLGGFASR